MVEVIDDPGFRATAERGWFRLSGDNRSVGRGQVSIKAVMVQGSIVFIRAELTRF